MGRDLFTCQGSTTVSSGGTTAPAQGTTQSWTVASSSGFPAASSTAVPATWFYVSDPALPSEVILVTNVSGTTWSVTRGADGTTPVAHTAGFTVRNVVTATWLQDLEDRRKFPVTRYGADPTGSADSTTAFTNCFADAASFGGTYGASEAVIPPGKYKIQGRVAINAGNFTIRAYGAYIFGGTDYNALGGAGNIMFMTNGSTGFTTGPSNVQVLGGIWDAKGQSAPTDGVRDIFCMGNARNWTFRDCVFRNVPSWHAIDANTIDGLNVMNCRFEGFVDASTGGTSRSFSEAIQMDAGGDSRAPINVTVEGNYCGPAVDGSGLGGFGKFVGSHTTSTNGNHKNIKVIGNTIESPLTYAIGAFQWENSVISNNTIIMPSGTATGINVDSVSVNVQVCNNTIENSGSSGHGIRVTGASVDTLVANNSITGAATAASSYGVQVATSGTKRTKVAGNSFYTIADSAIYVSSTASWVTITDNTIVGAARFAGSQPAIHLSGTVVGDIYVSGNQVKLFGSGNEANYAFQCDNGTPVRVIIGENDFTDFGTGFAPFNLNANANVNFGSIQPLSVAGSTTAVSTSITAITGLSITGLPAGSYSITAYIPLVTVGTPTLTATLSPASGPTTTSLYYLWSRKTLTTTLAGSSENVVIPSSQAFNTAATIGSTLAAGTYLVELQGGMVATTAGGTISISMTRTGGTSATVQAGAYLRLERVA